MPRAPQSDFSEPEFLRPGGDKQPRRGGAAVREEGEEEKDVFLRGKKRIPVKRDQSRIVGAGTVFLLLCMIGLTALAVRRYQTRASRFLIETSDNIETGTLNNVSRSQVLDIFGGDIGRNIFYVPLEARQRQLEQVPWIKSATVMRFLPNRMRVEISERTPVAFVEIGGTTGLIDAEGVVMSMPKAVGNSKFSFPVITGLTSVEPLSVRGARMKIFARLEKELDAGGAQYMRDVSEVDLSDPQDVRAIVGDGDGAVLVHLGSSDFQRRYRFYLQHIRAWRQQYQVRSVDLRYDGQVIVNREGQATEAPAPTVRTENKSSGKSSPNPNRERRKR